MVVNADKIWAVLLAAMMSTDRLNGEDSKGWLLAGLFPGG